MPCHNKFRKELRLDHIDYEPTTLIVGTFNPDLGEQNAAGWFYDMPTNCSFWDVLPRLYGEASLMKGTQDERRRFCRNHLIAVTDLISSIDDADPGDPEHAIVLSSYSDKAIAHHFDDFNCVDIVQLLQRRPSIRNVYLTRGITEAFWRHLWNPVIQHCSRYQIHERRLLPPLSGELYQHTEYNQQHPGDQIPLVEDYILMRWEKEWHF